MPEVPTVMELVRKKYNKRSFLFVGAEKLVVCKNIYKVRGTIYCKMKNFFFILINSEDNQHTNTEVN